MQQERELLKISQITLRTTSALKFLKYYLEAPVFERRLLQKFDKRSLEQRNNNVNKTQIKKKKYSYNVLTINNRCNRCFFSCDNYCLCCNFVDNLKSVSTNLNTQKVWVQFIQNSSVNFGLSCIR